MLKFNKSILLAASLALAATSATAAPASAHSGPAERTYWTAPSLAPNAPRHRELLRKVSDAPVRYILLTHGHGDHNGGVATWKEPGTEVVAQREYVEFMHYQNRLRGFFARRNAAQFQGQVPLDPSPASPGDWLQASTKPMLCESFTTQTQATSGSACRKAVIPKRPIVAFYEETSKRAWWRSIGGRGTLRAWEERQNAGWWTTSDAKRCSGARATLKR